MAYFCSGADFDWAVGRRNLCLIRNIHGANIADRFQLKGDTRGVAPRNDRAESHSGS